MKFALLPAAGIAITLLGGVATAQGPNPGPNSPTPGGPNSPPPAAGLAEPQPRFGSPGFGPPGIGELLGTSASSSTLLLMPDVRRELAVDADQQKAIDRAIADAAGGFRSVMEDFDPRDFFELEGAQRQERLGEIRRQAAKVAQQADGRIAEVLTKPQSMRLAEIRLQREGPAALLKPEVGKQVALTDEQGTKLAQIQAASQQQFEGGPPDFARLREARQESQNEMLRALTDEQRSKWTALLGKPFTFPIEGFGRGPGGPMAEERKLVARFDRDGDGRLNQEERQAARASLKQPAGGPGFGPPGGGFGFGPAGGGFGPPGGPGRRNREPARPGPRVSPGDAQRFPEAALYDPATLRTIFLDFAGDDWEAELSDFHGSDVETPATLTADGVKYPGVGVHFRGMSSYGGVPAGYKRSFNLAMDFVDGKQRLYGYKTLNLLNSHEDPSFLSTVLYSTIAREHIPAPKANFVKLVINGESWGVYVNVQQFNKEFVAENYGSGKGSRWKVRGSPGGGGGLEYLGDHVEDYRRRYEIKSDDNDQAWQGLIHLCRTLNQTAADELPAAIEPLLDVDGLLWFLALDVALINNDGYWVRASDYSIFRDAKGKFHMIPHDMNEAFHGGGGPPPGRAERRPQPAGPERATAPQGIAAGPSPPDAARDVDAPSGRERRDPALFPRGGPGGAQRGGRGVELDPLVGLNDPSKPLRSKILAAPEYRARYLAYVRTIAETSLDWKTLGPIVARYRALISEQVREDTRKLDSFEAFLRATADEPDTVAGNGRELPLRTFADRRRAYLLDCPAIKSLKP